MFFKSACCVSYTDFKCLRIRKKNNGHTYEFHMRYDLVKCPQDDSFLWMEHAPHRIFNWNILDSIQHEWIEVSVRGIAEYTFPALQNNFIISQNNFFNSRLQNNFTYYAKTW
jgi:hypothetical protein